MTPLRVDSLEALTRSVGQSINDALAGLVAKLDSAVDVLKDEQEDPSARARDALALLEGVRQSVDRMAHRIAAATRGRP